MIRSISPAPAPKKCPSARRNGYVEPITVSVRLVSGGRRRSSPATSSTVAAGSPIPQPSEVRPARAPAISGLIRNAVCGAGGFNWGGAKLVALMALVALGRVPVDHPVSVVAYTVGVGVIGGVIAVLDRAPWQAVFYTLVLIPAWAVGWLLRRERRHSAELTRLAAELAAERERRAEVAVAVERSRIARVARRGGRQRQRDDVAGGRRMPPARGRPPRLRGTQGCGVARPPSRGRAAQHRRNDQALFGGRG